MPNCFAPEEIYTWFRNTPRTFYTRKPSTWGNGLYTSLHEGFLHQKAFTPEPFYTTRPLYTPENPCIRNRLHKKPLRRPSTQEAIWTKQLWRQNVFTPNSFSPLSVASETVCTRSLLTPKACTPGTFTPCNFHTRGRLQQNFLQRIFTAKPVKTSSTSPKRALIYMRRLLHQKGFYNRICWHQEPCTPQRASHQKAFTPNALHTKELLHRKTFCTWGTTVLFTKIFLHQEAFAWHLGALTAESVYSRNHFRQRAATPLEFYTKKVSIRRRYTAKRDLGLQNTKTLYTQTSATVQLCHPGLQNSRRTAPLWIAITLFIPLPSSQCRDHFGQGPFHSCWITFPSQLSLVFTLISSSLERTEKYSTCDSPIWRHLHGRCSSSTCTSLFWKDLAGTGRRLQRRRPPFRHRPPFWYTSAILNE